MKIIRTYELSRTVTNEMNESFWYDVRDLYPMENYNYVVHAIGLEYESATLGNDIMNATLGLRKGKCFQFGIEGDNINTKAIDEICRTQLYAYYI